MTVDRYTKAVLTVIAGCLLWICAMGSGARVDAQQTTMPLPGTVQPVVIVGTGSMDRLGHIVVNFTGARTDPSVPVQLPYSATRPLPVSLPYTASSPMPSQLFYTADSPLPIAISSVRAGPIWDPVRVRVEPAPTRGTPGGGR
jgi:hypothetical protein